MELVNSILDYDSYKNFNEVDLKNLSLKQYEDIINSRILKLSDSDTQLSDCHLLTSFISAFTEQHKEVSQEIENIHYELLLKWMSFYQKETLSSILVGKQFVEFLSLKISLDKINQYNQVTQNSILKQLLLRYENAPLYQLLVNHGLKITDIEGLNPYYYTLLNSTSTNLTVQLLHLHNEPLPENIWSYVFNGIIDGKIKPERDYLLKLKDKQFIVIPKYQLSVWNRIIRHKKYNLIKYLNEDMYKPYTLDGKTLANEFLENNDLLFMAEVHDKIVKLVENEKELYPVWDSLLIDGVEKQVLIGIYTSMFFHILKELPEQEAKDILYKQKELTKVRENNVLYVLLQDITNYMYQQKELISNKVNDLAYKNLDDLIKVYKTRRDFPTELRTKIQNYLTSLSGYVEAAPKQSDRTIEFYEKDSEFIFNTVFEDIKFKEEQHFKNYVMQLNEEKKKIIFEQLSKIQEQIVLQHQVVIKETPKDKTETDYEFVGPEEEKILLFTDEALDKFKKNNNQSNNDIISAFVRKINTTKQNHQYKKLAKASVLLEQLDNLYTTFPHFENVINHIKNLMVLQDKGDKSFYIPPLLLGGGPGVGKTFFCHTVSKLVNTNFELLNMESMTANFILTGLSAQWSGAETGKIFKNLFNEENKTLNPIFLLDELEKAGGDNRYGVMNSLLPLLERYTAKKFKDECIPLEIDASYIVWFATANDLDKLTAPIKSRFDIFSVPNPTPVQRKSLIKGIYKTVRENNTWGSYFDEALPEDSLDVLANLMAPGAARDLRKSITMACSKAIVEESKIILPSHIERFETGETMPWDIITG